MVDVVDQPGIDNPEPLLPAYSGASISNVVPALLEHPAVGEGWMPDLAQGASQVVLLVQQGLAGLSSALVPGVMGGMMIAGGVVLVAVSRRSAARRLLSGEGLFLFPEALVIRRRPAGCQLYPRARIELDLWRGFGGAGSSSQMGGGSSRWLPGTGT